MSQTKEHYNNMISLIGSLTPFDEPDFVKTWPHCFAAQEQAKKFNRPQRCRRREQDYKSLFGFNRMWSHQQDIFYPASQDIERFYLFPNIGHEKQKFATKKEVGYCWGDKVSHKQTRSKWNNNTVNVQKLQEASRWYFENLNLDKWPLKINWYSWA